MKAPPARLGSITRVVTLVGVVLFWGITGFSRDSDEQADEADSLAPAWTSTDTKLANHYLRLLQKDPAYGQVLDLLWDLYEKKAQTDLLLQYLDEAASGDQAIAKVIHGHLLRKNGELDAARLRYDEALAIDASLIPPLKALAEIADQQGRSGKALSYYTRLLDQIPIETEDGLVIRLRKAQLHNQQGNREAAVELWNALLAAHASDAQLRGEIVAFLLEAGETETVISLLEESAEESGVRQQLAALNEIVRIHELVGDFDASIDAIDRALSKLHFRSHDYRSFFARKVRLHERFDRLSELEGRLRVAASPVDAPEKALNDLAELFHLTANPQEEEAIVSRIVERVPEDIDAKVRLARIQMRNDRYEAAATTLDSLLETEPNAPLSLIFLRARVALGADNRAEAESVLQSYLEAEVRPSEEVREIIDFARANYLDRLVESLLRDLGKSGVAGSDGVSAPLELARFLKERGRTDQAVETLASYVAGAGESVTERARRLFQQAVALGDLGLLREALASVDEAILLAPEKSEFLSARVTLLIDSDQVEAAVAQLESIRELTDGIDAVTEIDQRIFSLLRGQYQKEIEPPSIDPFSQASGMTTLEQFQRAATAVNQATLRAGNEPLPKELRDYYDAILKTASAEPSLSNRYRAAWWAFKLQNNQECYSQLVKATEEAGGPVLEAERLLLQLAEQNERLTLMVQHLGNLITLDPENAIEYRQRRAELRFELGYEDEAVRELKALAAAPDASLDTLSTLARVYRRQGNQRRQIEVWEQAYRRANLFEKRRVVKQLTTALIEMAQPQEALEAQLDLISRETDIIQRRKQFDAQVTLARKTGDEPGFRTSQPQLDWLIERYRAFAAESPFDHFYPEALARLYAEVGEDELAFEAMKKAYYMSGQDDRLLSPLGDLAEEVDDLNAAIYYTRQQLARGEGEESIENWANLIGMLEKSFRVEEADAVRQRLEGRFGRDPEFLESLVLEYEKQGSIRAQTRVLERLVALRPWDLTSHFRLGLVRRKRGDDEAAKQSFAAVIVGSEPFALPDDRDAMPLPLLRSSTIDSDIRDDPTLIFEPWLLSIESMPYLGGNLQDEMATVLQKPYPEFTEIPQDEPYLRLRA
ncbi:MAG: tetratricopeptide repeat protein, partial [Verrucomicrobiota bacterium]